MIEAGPGSREPAGSGRAARMLERVWYGRSPLRHPLRPLGALFCLVARSRRVAYRRGLLRAVALPLPVVVVGNIAVGGTGKTPLVVWIARHLAAQGWSPGIVSRGYAGRATHWPQRVHAHSDPGLVGDEPVLLARRAGCPVVVAPDRVAAAQVLLAAGQCDLILGDDGLQHYRLRRDLEIAVIDGLRGLGNGLCLPAGPLREPPERLGSVDLVVVNGGEWPGAYGMDLSMATARSLTDGEARPLTAFAEGPVHAIAGIGHPERFFRQLRDAGLQVMARAFPDHHAYAPQDLAFSDGRPVLMTEKDAIKCERFARPGLWSIPVTAQVEPAFGARLRALLPARPARPTG